MTGFTHAQIHAKDISRWWTVIFLFVSVVCLLTLFCRASSECSVEGSYGGCCTCSQSFALCPFDASKLGRWSWKRIKKILLCVTHTHTHVHRHEWSRQRHPSRPPRAPRRLAAATSRSPPARKRSSRSCTRPCPRTSRTVCVAITCCLPLTCTSKRIRRRVHFLPSSSFSPSFPPESIFPFLL